MQFLIEVPHLLINLQLACFEVDKYGREALEKTIGDAISLLK